MSKKHTVIFIGAILILGALSIYDIAEYKNYKEKQFEKINKLNNDLIKVSQVVSQQQKDIEYLDIKIAENSVEIGELKRILSELDDSYKSLFNLLFELQSQKLTEKSQGAETTTPHITPEDVNPPSSSQVSAPPPKISTPIEREQEVVTIKRDNAPVPVKVIASCPRPTQNLGKFINNISLRKDYSFVVSYDIKDRQINNVEFNKTVPLKLQRAIEKYLNSFILKQDKEGCRIPIKLLKG